MHGYLAGLESQATQCHCIAEIAECKFVQYSMVKNENEMTLCLLHVYVFVGVCACVCVRMCIGSDW